MPDDITALLITVSDNVLKVIKNIADKQGENKRPISVDTIALAVRTSIKDLKPVIDHLQSAGHITVHHNPSLNHNKVNNPYTVTLL